jgi:hypothetical protein
MNHDALAKAIEASTTSGQTTQKPPVKTSKPRVS